MLGIQGSVAAPTTKEAFDWFLTRAVPGCRNIDIGRLDLLQLLSSPTRCGPVLDAALPCLHLTIVLQSVL